MLLERTLKGKHSILVGGICSCLVKHAWHCGYTEGKMVMKGQACGYRAVRAWCDTPALGDVWSQGLTVVDDCLVSAVDDSSAVFRNLGGGPLK